MVIKQTDTNPQNFVKRYEYFQYHCEYSDKVSKNHMQQVVNYQNKTFSQPAVFKKKFRRQSESQPRFFGEMIPGRPKNGEFDTWIVINGTKTNSYHHQNDEYIWAMVIKQTDINT